MIYALITIAIIASIIASIMLYQGQKVIDNIRTELQNKDYIIMLKNKVLSQCTYKLVEAYDEIERLQTYIKETEHFIYTQSDLDRLTK